MKKLYHISDAVTADTVSAMKSAAVPAAVPFVINEKVTDKIHSLFDHS